VSRTGKENPVAGAASDAASAPPVPDPFDAEPDTTSASPARPLVGSFAATGAIQLIQAVTGVLLARVLGPSGRGELAAVILWPTILTVVGSLGLSQASTYLIARAKNRAIEGALVGTVLVLLALCATALVVIGLIAIPLALSDHDPEVVSTAKTFLVVFIPINLLAVIAMSLVNGQHRFKWYQGLRMLVIGAILASVLTLDLVGELTVQTGAAAYVFAYVLGAALGTFLVVRSVWGDLAVRKREARALLGFGLKSQLSQSMWSLNERVDQLVISIFFSAASLGLYVVAVTLTSLTTLIGFSFALVALPVIARLEVTSERQRVAKLIVSATLVCATVVSIPIFILEPTLIRLLFGEAFIDAAGVGRVLLVAGVVFGLNRVLEALLQAVGRPLESSIGEGVALAVTAAGLAVLLPTLGIMGAGVTSLIAYTASSAFMVRRAAKALDLPALSLLKPERGMIQGIRSMTRLVPGFGKR